jgi:acetyltransferase-like isoleucine patch superfamily enzyme
MINKIFKSIYERYFFLELYERFIVYSSQFQGHLCKLFYKFLFNKRISFGSNFLSYGFYDIRLHKNSNIIIRDNVTFGSSSKKSALSINSNIKLTCLYKGKIIIDNNVAINGSNLACRSTLISIGEGSIIAPNCIITDSNFHAISPPFDRNHNLAIETDSEIVIKKNVWVGMNSIILKGVTIEDNSIIAAGSVVTQNVKADSIYGGNPARFIKKINKQIFK